jgi:hypothetical protein
MQIIYIYCANYSDEEHSLPLSSVLKRRAQALIIFVGHALQTSSAKHRGDFPTSKAISDLISLLVHMATLHGGSSPESNIDYISSAAQFTMSLSLGAIPATDFISAVLITLESNEARVCPNSTLLPHRLICHSDSKWGAGCSQQSPPQCYRHNSARGHNGH